MDEAKQPKNNKSVHLNHNRIARAIFAAAESMGIRDRNLVERLTAQMIERLEQPQTLPGMEHLVTKHRQQRPLPTEAEIEAMVREILAVEEPTPTEEAITEMETTSEVQPQVQSASGIKQTE